MGNHMNRIFLALVGILAFASTAGAQVSYNRFAPANGVLKGNTATYVTMPAASSDIIGLWTGTCSSATFLRGDGSCQTPAGGGGGTVNSVALAAPSVFGVTGSPVTNTGTLTLAFASGQTANSFLASPDGTTGAVGLRLIVADDLPPIDLTSGVTGTLPVANGGTAVTSLGNLTKADDTNVTLTLGGTPTGALIKAASITAGWTGQLAVARGGTGAASLTGVLKGNTTSAISSAASADVYGLWSGTCNSTTFLRGDGSCQTPVGTTVGANPTGTIGLSAVNGVATTFLRSDGAPALSQAITPTWTGAHTFSNASTAITVANSAATAVNSVSIGGTTTAYNYVRLANTTGTVWWGVEGSAGGELFVGAPAYSSIVGSPGATALCLATGTTCRMTLASGGAATFGGVLLGPAGSANDPTFALSGDTNTGIYSVGADSLGVTTGGTKRVTVGPGVQVGAPTGGDKGAGTINATGLFINNVAVGAGSASRNVVSANRLDSTNVTTNCTVNTSFGTTTSDSGVSSCTRTGTGTYTFVYATASGLTPAQQGVCTANAANSGAIRFAVVTNGTFTVTTYAPTTGVAADSTEIYITCAFTAI